MLIGVVGGGTVGRATARCFMEHAEVKVFDTNIHRRTHTLAETLKSDLVFVCLPSPQKPNSLECDTSFIDDFFASHKGSQTNFVLRSTVPIGTTRWLRETYNLPNIVHSPEFLTARCAVTDAQVPARNVIGFISNPPKTEHIRDDLGDLVINYPTSICYRIVRRLYEERFPGIPVHVMSPEESEAVKLVQNSFFAVKVAFFNEARSLADKLNLDWDRILAAVLADGRIAHAHTRVPGPDGKYGFGGTCLPKDLANFTACLRAAGCNSEAVALAAYQRNIYDRDKA